MASRATWTWRMAPKQAWNSDGPVVGAGGPGDRDLVGPDVALEPRQQRVGSPVIVVGDEPLDGRKAIGVASAIRSAASRGTRPQDRRRGWRTRSAVGSAARRRAWPGMGRGNMRCMAITSKALGSRRKRWTSTCAADRPDQFGEFATGQRGEAEEDQPVGQFQSSAPDRRRSRIPRAAPVGSASRSRAQQASTGGVATRARDDAVHRPVHVVAGRPSAGPSPAGGGGSGRTGRRPPGPG